MSQNQKALPLKRECGTCTKCCEGYLHGVAYDKPFFPGKPCHFVSIGKGCTIYASRPKDPCITYRCQWLINPEIPEWFKPNEINAIITKRTIEKDNIEFYDLIEAGEKMKAEVLSWIIMYALNNSLNLRWVVDGGSHWIGSKEFIAAMNENTSAP